MQSVPFSPSLVRDGWDVYVILEEFKRQGVPRWKPTPTAQFQDPNDQTLQLRVIACWKVGGETLCKTYPKYIYVPANLTDDQICECAKFRTKNRLPALAYFYSNKASLWRSSQVKSGVMKNRSEEDEQMIKSIGRTNPNTSDIVVYDARSKIVAMANRLKSGGYENIETYKNIKSVEFGSIDNIHAVRQAYKNLLLHCTNSDDQSVFWQKIESFRWIEFIQKIL